MIGVAPQLGTCPNNRVSMESVSHHVAINDIYFLDVPQIVVQVFHHILVFRWLRKDGPRAIAKLHLVSPAC